MLTSVHDDTMMMTYLLLDLPHRGSVSHHARFELGRGRTFLFH